jgi:hypothetical protein
MSIDSNAADFREWLTRDDGIDGESARSYVSSLRSVESKLPTILERYLRSDAGRDAVLTMIDLAIPNAGSADNYKTATRHYAQFLQQTNR